MIRSFSNTTKSFFLLVVAVGAVFIGRHQPGPLENVPSYRQKGPADAPVVLHEFSDLQCGRCADVQKHIDALLAANPGKVRLVFHHYPLPMHKFSAKAAEASECAGAQGKFWEMASALFATQKKWEEMEDPSLFFAQTAKELGLDVKTFETDFKSGRFKAGIEQDKKQGDSLPVSATPTFLMNDRVIVGDSQFQAFAQRFLTLELEKSDRE